jgi:ubiquinone biosynthesis protein UbiJ
MSTDGLLTAGLEQAANLLIGLDPMARRELAPMHGKVIAIELRGLATTLYFIPDQNGELQIYSHYEGEPDCTMSGSPLDLLKSSDKEQGAAQLFGGQVTIEGDAGLAHRFGAILANLDLDWEEQLSKITGDLVAHQVGRTVRGGQDYLKEGVRTFEENLGEYLTEEARFTPHRFEMEEFLHSVDELRDDVERLAARIGRLAEQGDKGDNG